jgi:predicted MPP superfamily phosphohydrolase
LARAWQWHALWGTGMEDRRLKRELIERGQLKTWSRRGKYTYAEYVSLPHALLERGLRLMGLYARGERNALRPELKQLRFAFDTLPAAFHGFRILHLSDLHADGLTGLPEILAAQLQSLEADLCVLTGDYRFRTTGSCHQVYPNMARILASVHARHGIVGILGNHDVSEMVPALGELGVRMLMNESCALRRESQRIWLIGLDDPHYYGCDDLPGALRSVPEQAFKILLVHTPEMLEEAHQNGIHLYLCGHTHGGQIRLPFIGPVITHTNCPRAYVRGAWQYKSMCGYTSPGVGCTGVTARFLCPPEIVLIELCRTSLLEQRKTAQQHRTVCYPCLSFASGSVSRQTLSAGSPQAITMIQP